jgi:hypothetical protein
LKGSPSFPFKKQHQYRKLTPPPPPEKKKLPTTYLNLKIQDTKPASKEITNVAGWSFIGAPNAPGDMHD